MQINPLFKKQGRKGAYSFILAINLMTSNKEDVMKRKFVSLVLCFMLVLGLSIPTSAAFEMPVEIPPPGYGEQYSTPENPFNFGPRADKMTPEQEKAAGIVDPFAGIQPFATVEKLCYIAGGSYTVYSTATGSSSKGFVSSRERVWVYNNNSNANRYYIRFLNYGTIDYGYVDKAAVKIPSTSWSAPITTGSISQDYSAGGHAGIDVAAPAGTQVNAVTSVSHRSRIYTGVLNGTTYLVNYGNYIDCTSGGTQVIYAHLSKFTNGTANTTLSSYRSRFTGTESISTVATFTPSAGAKIGEVGNTGWSSGNHLHFETRNASNISTKYDPYTYVVFPGVGY